MLQELLATNIQLLEQLSIKDKEIARLRNQRTPAPATAPAPAPATRQQHQPGPGKKCFDNDNYCWSCGYDVSLNHTSSESCKRKLQAHKYTATRTNNMEGSQRNKAKVY
jgi:hypothetical protein